MNHSAGLGVPSCLVVVSGRSGTGKTTVAREAARRLHACYLRVDAAETALTRVGVTNDLAGYAVVHELAVSNLLLGHPVVVDAVNPVPQARAGWRDAAHRAGTRLVHVELVLTDRAEHQRRVETRVADIPGHRVPTWHEVERHEWVPWDEDRDGRRVTVDATYASHAVDAVVDAALRAAHG